MGIGQTFHSFQMNYTSFIYVPMKYTLINNVCTLQNVYTYVTNNTVKINTFENVSNLLLKNVLTTY